MPGAALPPAVGMAVHERGLPQVAHEHGAGGESADVRPERDAAPSCPTDTAPPTICSRNPYPSMKAAGTTLRVT